MKIRAASEVGITADHIQLPSEVSVQLRNLFCRAKVCCQVY